MTLTEPSRGTSFYESFSDLIFGTLVLLIVLVMALAIRLQETQAQHRETTSEVRTKVLKVVYPNRFAGGSDTTYVYIGHVPIDGKTHLVWIPGVLSREWDLVRRDNLCDPVLRLCEFALSNDGLTFMSLGELRSLSQGLNLAFCADAVDEWRIGRAIHVMRSIMARHPGRMWTPQALKRAMGGLQMRLPSSYEPFLAEYNQWLFDASGHPIRHKETIAAMARMLQGTKDQPSRLRFTALSEPTVLIGKQKVHPRDLRNVLRAIKPGKGFYLEHVSPNGTGTEPPAWVLRKVLEAVGFAGRVLSDEAQEVLSGG